MRTSNLFMSGGIDTHYTHGWSREEPSPYFSASKHSGAFRVFSHGRPTITLSGHDKKITYLDHLTEVTHISKNADALEGLAQTHFIGKYPCKRPETPTYFVNENYCICK